MNPVLSITMFVVLGLVFVLMNLTISRIVRPSLPHPRKQAAYECGSARDMSALARVDPEVLEEQEPASPT